MACIQIPKFKFKKEKLLSISDKDLSPYADIIENQSNENDVSESLMKTTVLFENDSFSNFKNECKSALLPFRRKSLLISTKYGLYN